MNTRYKIIVNGVHYSCSDVTAARSGEASRLQLYCREQYGENSFQTDVANFLAEWFSDSPTLEVHTSGSTGKPKAMMVEKERMVNSAMMTISYLGLKEGNTAMLCMPMAYIAGKMVVVRALVAGLNLLTVPPCGHPLAHMTEAPAFAAMIPMQVYNTLQEPHERELMTRIGHLLIGGGAIDKDMGRRLSNFPNSIWSTYGMTETLSHIALRPLSRGKASEWYTPLSNVRVEATADGTLVIEAPLVNAKRLVTNDMVEFNAEGQFRILGRKDNTINTGGIKIQIEEVEDEMKKYISCPCMITSVPDAKFGERIVLLTTSSEIERIDKAIGKLPSYWRPKEIIRVKSLPLTETGKPSRAMAKKMAIEALQAAL